MSMSTSNTTPASGGEALQPETPVVRRYIVTITEIASAIRHEQTFREVVPAIPGVGKVGDRDAVAPVPAKMGYITTAKQITEKSTLFEATFSTRPKISALAKLMEDGDA